MVSDKKRSEAPLSSGRNFVNASKKRLSLADPRNDDKFPSSVEFEENELSHSRFNACLLLIWELIKAFLALSLKKATRHMRGNDAH